MEGTRQPGQCQVCLNIAERSRDRAPRGKAEAQSNLAAVFGKQEQTRGAQREVDNLNRQIGELTSGNWILQSRHP